MDLSGVRVLDLTQLLPGPYGTQLLADMGADVVKVERPGGGDPLRELDAVGGRALFESVNRGKRSISLDLSQETGRKVFYQLVADADIVFEQFRPGAVEQLGVGYADIRERNQSVVYCSLSSFGQTGPYRDKPAHDLNVAGLSGFLDLTRPSPSSAPVPPGYPVIDMAAGLFAVSSILGALLARELGNRDGAYIDIGMLDVALSLSQVVSAPLLANPDLDPAETRPIGTAPCCDVYVTADGKYVTIVALEPAFWRAFCDAIDRPDLREHHLTPDGSIREVLREELVAEFSSRTRAEWTSLLADRRLPIAPVESLAEALDDPHVEARELLTQSSAGPCIGFPALGTVEFGVEGTAPVHGEHTRDLLVEHGFDEAEIADLANRGVI